MMQFNSDLTTTAERIWIFGYDQDFRTFRVTNQRIAPPAGIDLGDEIPENLYRAVAEVIAFAYLLEGRVSPLPTPGHGQPEGGEPMPRDAD